MLNDSNFTEFAGVTTSTAPPELLPIPGASLVIKGTFCGIVPTSKNTPSPFRFSGGIPYLSAYSQMLLKE